MFAHYCKITLRNLLKQKVYSLINIFGFAVGLSAVILIVLYVRFETSYDTFHQNGDNLYRASFVHKQEGSVRSVSPVFTPPFGPAAAGIPGVRSFVRLSTPRVAYAAVGDEPIRLSMIRHADSSFFQVFSFPLLAGDSHRALVNPYSIVLSESVARLLFGKQDPMGSLLRLDDKGPYLVTGVVGDPPPNSSIQFSALISFSTLYEDKNLFLDWDGGNQYVAYLELAPQARIPEVEKQCSDILWQNLNKRLSQIGVEIIPVLHPLKDVHLYHDEGSETLQNNLMIFSAVAIFILILACVNFINLTTARALRRAKEVGIRKTFGAARRYLVLQFLGEALVVTFVGLLTSVLLVEFAMAWYVRLVGEHTGFVATFTLPDVLVLLVAVLFIGIAAGSYPAFYLSRFHPAALQGKVAHGSAKSLMRNLLVVFQFAVSVALIVCTLLVGAQLRYMHEKELGFTNENMMVLALRGSESRERADVLKQEILALPGVADVAASSEVPSAGFTSNGYFPEGHATPMMIHVVDIDERFLASYGLTVTAGRGFSSDREADRGAYLINETLAATLGWERPVGKTITRNGDHQVIGVVKDFHFASLRDKIEPLIFTNHTGRSNLPVLSVRIRPENIAGTISALRETMKRVAPSAPFEFSFLDDRLNVLYQSEQQFEDLFFSFSVLAIILAMMGLLGLTAFSTEQRTKEIGVRKILGASASGVVGLLSKDFARLIAIASFLAWPVAYYFMNQWLEHFAYRVELPWEVFFIAGGGVLILALLAISAQAVKAARANPVESLRYE